MRTVVPTPTTATSDPTATSAGPTSTGARAARRTRTARIVADVVAGLAGGAAAVAGHLTGTLGAALGYLVVGAAAVTVVTRLVGAARGRLELGIARGRWGATPRRHFAQLGNRVVFWVLAGTVAGMAVPTGALTGGQATLGVVIGWAAVAVLVALAFVPLKRVLIGSNAVLAAMSLFLGAQLVGLSLPAPADAVTIASPVRGEWYVGSGGRSALLNHHHGVGQQRYAVDLAMRPQPGNPQPAWGQELRAPADGTVVRAVGDLPDTRDATRPAGNHVVLDIGGDRYVLMAHLRQGSLAVAVGQRVRVGDRLGAVGNSGNSTGAHLHLQVQDGPDLTTADGGFVADLRAFPVTLGDATRLRGGDEAAPAADLRRNDLVRTA
jgi:peptidase M23-like protein